MMCRLSRVLGISLLTGLMVASGRIAPAQDQGVSIQNRADTSPALLQVTPVSYEKDECDADCASQCSGLGSACRMTLFQWSYGTSFEGGADLSEPLVTDRPDFTESSSTVGLGVGQLELGYTYTYDNDNSAAVRSESFPETLLRYGLLAQWLELRVGWNYAEERTRTSATSTTVTGAEDLYLGIKIAITPQEGILPEMALIPQVTVPTGSAALTDDEVLAGLNWVYGWEISDLLATGGSSQFNRVLDEGTGDNYLEFAQSWTLAYSLSESVGAYTEWYAFIPSGADTAKAEHYFNGGFSYLLSNDLQLDVRAGIGLNSVADDYFLGTGASVRF